MKKIPPHLLVAASAWVGRAVSAVVQLLSIRILISTLGTESYAVFVILYGLTGWYLLTDLGFGFSLQNFISERRATDRDCDDLLEVAGFAGVVLLVLGTLLLWLASPLLGSALLRQFAFLSAPQRTQLFFITGLLLLATTVGGIVYKIWYALQKGYLANLVPAVGAIIGLALVRGIPHLVSRHKLYWSLLAFLAPTAALALTSFALVLRRNWVRSPIHAVTTLRAVVPRAAGFWFFALMSAGVLQIDYIVLSRFMPPEQIVIYNIATKVFMFVFFVYNAALLAVWPVYTELIARQDWKGVVSTIGRYVGAGTVLVLAATALVSRHMPIIVRLLAPGADIVVPVGLIYLLGGYFLIRVWTDMFAVVLQSMSNLKPLWIAVPIQAILSIGLQWVLAPRWGLYGVVIGLMASFLLTVSWLLPLAVQRSILTNSLESDSEAQYLHSDLQPR